MRSPCSSIIACWPMRSGRVALLHALDVARAATDRGARPARWCCSLPSRCRRRSASLTLLISRAARARAAASGHGDVVLTVAAVHAGVVTSARRSRSIPRAGCQLVRAYARRAGSDAVRQRLFEIGDDVVLVLDADREAHHVGAGAGLHLLRVGQLAVRGRGRMDDQRARVADIGEMREQLARSTRA